MQLKIKLFGEMKCPKSYRIRDFLQRNGTRYQCMEIARNEDTVLQTGLGSVDCMPENTVSDRSFDCFNLLLVGPIG